MDEQRPAPQPAPAPQGPPPRPQVSETTFKHEEQVIDLSHLPQEAKDGILAILKSLYHMF